MHIRDGQRYIRAKNIKIGKGVIFGKNVDINVKEEFSVGDYSKIGDNTKISGRRVTIGKHFFGYDWPQGLEIGLGRYGWEDAVLTIGDRCTFHNNRIDLSRPVSIGDDVGLSPEVVIYTHGYWLSYLDGYPVSFKGVTIGSGVIVGFRSLLLAGANVGAKTVIGAQSVATGSLVGGAIYAGNPARFIRNVAQLMPEEQQLRFNQIVGEYKRFCRYRGVSTPRDRYPFVYIGETVVDLLRQTVEGDENEYTDDLREFIFRYGVRIYTERPFRTISTG